MKTRKITTQLKEVNKIFNIFYLKFKSLHYLDSHFLEQKVKRIKYLADLIRKIHRFDQHIHNIDGSVTRHMNTLGIHILDQELQEENS